MKKIPEKALYKLLEQLGLSPEDRGDYFKVVCPSCGMKEAFAYKNSSLIICSRKNRCNHSESVIDLARREKSFKKDIFKSLGEVIPKKEEVKKDAELVLPEGLSFFSDVGKEGIIANKVYNYLISRGISDYLINTLGYVYNPRKEIEIGVFIPFYENKELVYYIVRNINNKSKKRYDNPRGINANNFIFNYDNIEEGNTICITEGVFDAISISNYIGTAMLTSSLSKQQASKLYDKAPSKIIYIPDNDDAGRDFTRKNIDLLIRYKPPSIHVDYYIYTIPDEYKDLNEIASEKKDSVFIDLKDCILYSDFKKNFKFQRRSPL